MKIRVIRKPPLDAQRRFFKKVRVNIDAPDLDACWPWLGHIDKDGHGQFKLNGKVEYAHRVAYAILHDKTPRGKLILHQCENPGCVNPTHLYPGNARANMLDFHYGAEMRKHYGINAPKKKEIDLADLVAAVLQDGIMRSRSREFFITPADVGKKLGVSAQAVGRVAGRAVGKLRAQGWKANYVRRSGGPFFEVSARAERNPRRKVAA